MGDCLIGSFTAGPRSGSSSPSFRTSSCALSGLDVDLRLRAGAPVTVNDPAAFTRAYAAAVVGADSVRTLAAPVAAFEDVGLIARAVPSTPLFVGAGRDGGGSGDVHSPNPRIDERCLAVGAAVDAAIGFGEGCRDEGKKATG
nr:M20/M25/M40 family metallo-hydrolase [Rhizohabitans arisaemae]